jgi:hypothetical protein
MHVFSDALRVPTARTFIGIGLIIPPNLCGTVQNALQPADRHDFNYTSTHEFKSMMPNSCQTIYTLYSIGYQIAMYIFVK